MKVIVSESLGAGYTANIISSCNDAGVQAIADYNRNEILFYDPANKLFARHSDLIKNMDIEIFDMFRDRKQKEDDGKVGLELRKEVMKPTEGEDFENFATEWDALQKQESPDILKTKNCSMIRFNANEATLSDGGMDDNVSEWYAERFPDDDLAGRINKQVTFQDAMDCIDYGADIYDLLETGDSTIRERLFAELSARTGIEYGKLYRKWLKNSAFDESIDNRNDWSATEDESKSSDAVERFRRRWRKLGAGTGGSRSELSKKDKDHLVRLKDYHDDFGDGVNGIEAEVSESNYEDDPRDWSASEGEVEIMWKTDFEEFGIEPGDTSTYLIDYDMAETHEQLIDEISRMIGKEYPDLDFIPEDFEITNEDEFWEQRGGNPGKWEDEMYSEGEFETMADIDDEQVWDDVGIDDNDNVVEGIPNWATCYIMYGDDSNLTPEDVAMVDKFVKDLEKDGLRLSHPISGSENEFNSYPAFGDACDTVDWSCEVV